MKKLLKIESLPLQVLILGAAAAAVRGLLYLTAVDEKNLLASGHPISWLLWLVCAAAAVLILTSAGKLKGSNRYFDNFAPGMSAAVGCWIMALGILLTLMAGNPLYRMGLLRLWLISGILAAAGLIWAGYDRMQNRQPSLLAYAAMCLFMAVHMVSRYQAWSGNPQAQDWVFSLLATAGLTLCAYHHSAFCAGLGRRRQLLAVQLLTLFLCCGAVVHTEFFVLYLCGGFWACTDLCRVMPAAETTDFPAETTTETE